MSAVYIAILVIYFWDPTEHHVSSPLIISHKI